MRDEKNILETSLFNTLELGFFSQKFCPDFNELGFIHDCKKQAKQALSQTQNEH
jgi:hypothetical protein